jgi:hypothetical protein
MAKNFTVETDPLLDFGLHMPETYNLHADTAGKVANLIQYLLIGLLNPTEFYAELQGLGIEATVVQKLMNDLNEIIFIPLHSKMAQGSPNLVQKNVPAPISAQIFTVTQSAEPIAPPPPVITTPIAPVKPFIPAPIPQPMPAEIAIPIYSSQAPVPNAPVYDPSAAILPQNIPMVHTMAQDMQNAMAHPTAPIQAPAYVSPVPQQPIATPAPPSAPTSNRDALHAVMKEYGVDPYREVPD